MNSSDSFQISEKFQPGSNKTVSQRFVDLSNPNEVSNLFRLNQPAEQSLQSSNQLSFDNPFQTGAGSGQWPDLWHADTGASASTDSGAAGQDMPQSGSSLDANSASSNGSDTSPQSSLSKIEQTLDTDIKALDKEIQSLDTELNQILSALGADLTGSSDSSAPGDSSSSSSPSESSDSGSDSGSDSSCDSGSDSSCDSGSDSSCDSGSDSSCDSGSDSSCDSGSDSSCDSGSGSDCSDSNECGSNSPTKKSTGASPTSPAKKTAAGSSGTSAAKAPSDAHSSSPAKAASDSHNSSATKTPTNSNTSSATKTPTDSNSSSTTTTPTENNTSSAPTATQTYSPGENITQPGSKPTSSNAFIADLQMADPVLAKTMTDASTQMSSAGYNKVLNYVDNEYTSNKNWNSGNPNFDSSVMKSALTISGLSTSDQSALTNVLNKDMPAALASDTFAASVQQSDPAMAKMLSDVKGQMSPSDYETFEGYIKQHYSGNPNESQGLPDQTFLDNVLLNNSISGAGLGQSAQNSLRNTLKQDMPGAVSNDVYLSSVQEMGDGALAKVMTDASGKLSKAGYSQLESYMEENSTWNPANDGSLLHQALSQGGLNSGDQSSLQSVLQADMPQALTDAPSSSVLNQMAQAKFNYQNEYSLDFFNHPQDIQGNPGKTGTSGTNDDQQPDNVYKIGPWAAVTPLNPDSYDKNAEVTVSDPNVYFHLKTGGWVEALPTHDNSSSDWWEGHYNNSFTANVNGNGVVNADGSYTFTAPPSDMPVDHFGTQGIAYNPNLYDGVYETIQAKANENNSGLSMNLGADYYQSADAPAIRQGAESNWVPLTNTNQTLYLTDMSPSAIEADPPPGL